MQIAVAALGEHRPYWTGVLVSLARRVHGSSDGDLRSRGHRERMVPQSECIVDGFGAETEHHHARLALTAGMHTHQHATRCDATSAAEKARRIKALAGARHLRRRGHFWVEREPHRPGLAALQQLCAMDKSMPSS